MLPPGHIAAGYLTARAYEAIFKPHITTHQGHILLWLGAFFGFIPDIDMFLAFFKLKSFTIQSEKVNHRVFATHIPWIWMLLGLLVALFGKISGNSFTIAIGFMLWLGTWSHFILDSIYYGVRWLWPFSEKCYALLELRSAPAPDIHTGFLRYWIGIIKAYFQEQPVTAYLEILLILGAILSLWFH